MGWLTAVQAQDYPGAKWALGLRTRDATEAELDRLFDAGEILRTHVLRPTWHFVLPGDVRWLLELTAPRIKAQMAFHDRYLGVDADLVRRGRRVLEKELRDGAHRTRPQLAAALAAAGLPGDGQVVGTVLMHAELDAIVASGARHGRSQTYALLAERAPEARRRAPEEALAELAVRYFSSHGPAQVQDCAWWSGLTMADVKRGLALAGSALVRETTGGKDYWLGPGAGTPAPPSSRRALLLPNYDEYVVAYRDRTAALDPARDFDTAPFPMGSILAHTVLVDGQVWGNWKRRPAGREMVVELGGLDALDAEGVAALHRAAQDFSRFLELPVRMVGL